MKGIEKVLAQLDAKSQEQLNLEDVALLRQVLKQNDQILRIQSQLSLDNNSSNFSDNQYQMIHFFL